MDILINSLDRLEITFSDLDGVVSWGDEDYIPDRVHMSIKIINNRDGELSKALREKLHQYKDDTTCCIMESTVNDCVISNVGTEYAKDDYNERISVCTNIKLGYKKIEELKALGFNANDISPPRYKFTNISHFTRINIARAIGCEFNVYMTSTSDLYKWLYTNGIFDKYRDSTNTSTNTVASCSNEKCKLHHTTSSIEPPPSTKFCQLCKEWADAGAPLFGRKCSCANEYAIKSFNTYRIELIIPDNPILPIRCLQSGIYGQGFWGTPRKYIGNGAYEDPLISINEVRICRRLGCLQHDDGVFVLRSGCASAPKTSKGIYCFDRLCSSYHGSIKHPEFSVKPGCNSSYSL